jgi:hypothetical protein
MIRKSLSRTKGKRSRSTGHLERKRKMTKKTSKKSPRKTKER